MRKVYHFRVVRMMWLFFAAAPAFVAASILLLLDQPDNPAVLIISGAGILFFGGCLIVGIICMPRLLADSEALILTPQGLTIRHAAKRRRHFIPWEEIEALSDFYIRGDLFIRLHLRNPGRDIEREGNAFYRLATKLNKRCFGTPFSISAASLRCDGDELVSTLVHYLESYGRNARRGK